MIQFEACKGCYDELPDGTCSGNFLNVDLKGGEITCLKWECVPQILSDKQIISELWNQIASLESQISELS